MKVTLIQDSEGKFYTVTLPDSFYDELKEQIKLTKELVDADVIQEN